MTDASAYDIIKAIDSLEVYLMSQELFRKLVKWFGIVAVLHLVAMLVFGILLSSNVAALEDADAFDEASVTVFFFDIAINIVFVIVYMKAVSSFADYSKAIAAAMKEEAFSVIGYYKTAYLKLDLLRIAVFAVFQLPFVIFASIFGISFLYSSGIERFYIFEAGYYALTGSPILGFLISVAVFAVCLIISEIISIAAEKRSRDT